MYKRNIPMKELFLILMNYRFFCGHDFWISSSNLNEEPGKRVGDKFTHLVYFRRHQSSAQLWKTAEVTERRHMEGKD